LYSVKKNRAELNKELKEALCFQELLGGGYIVQYEKVWDLVVEMLASGMFPETEFHWIKVPLAFLGESAVVQNNFPYWYCAWKR